MIHGAERAVTDSILTAHIVRPTGKRELGHQKLGLFEQLNYHNHSL